ncbi:hypothetical protein Tco_0417026 [Tanacetum coccineum]
MCVYTEPTLKNDLRGPYPRRTRLPPSLRPPWMRTWRDPPHPRKKVIPTPSNDPQPSSEDSMKLTDLMDLCTKLQTQVLDLEKAKDAQAKEITALKKRVQKLERKKTSRTTGLKRLKKEGLGRSIADIDADVEVTLVDKTQDRQDDELMFDTGVLDTDDMPVEAKVDEKDEQSTKLDDSTVGEAVTTASVEDSAAPTKLLKIEPSKFRVSQEVQPSISPKDKGKGIMIETGVLLKRKDQISLDEQITRDIQAKLDAELIEEQKLARKQEEETNIALIEQARKKMLGRKRAGKEQQQEFSKKQRMEEDKESDEVDEASEDDEADGSSKRYSSVIRMLQGIDKEDLEALWKIVKTKYSDKRPEDEFERVLWGDLKVMFEPDIRSDVWRILQGYRVTIWKLIDSSGVHFVRRNLKIQKMNIKFRGGLLGLKRLHGFLEVTTVRVHNGNYAKCIAGEKITTVGLKLLEDFLLSRG